MKERREGEKRGEEERERRERERREGKKRGWGGVERVRQNVVI